MSDSLNMGIGEVIFIVISCLELAMGMLGFCGIEFGGTRFILWGFLAYYASFAVMNLCYDFRENSLKIHSLIFLGVCIISGVFVYVTSGFNSVIKGTIYVYCLQKIHARRYCRMYLITEVLVMGISAISNTLWGFGTGYVTDIRSYRGMGGIRYSFGFSNPNIFMGFLFVLIIVYLLYRSSQIRLWEMAALECLLFLFYDYTDTRTVFLLGSFVIGGCMLLHISSGSQWTMILFCLFCMVLFATIVISILAAAHIEGPVMSGINYFISGRFDQLGIYRPANGSSALPYIENWHLWGSRANHGFYDMGYIILFYNYGVICTMLFLGYYIFSAIHACWDENAVKLLCMCAMSVYVFMEGMLFGNYVPLNGMLLLGALQMEKKTSVFRGRGEDLQIVEE